MGDDILKKYIAFSDNRQGKTAYGKVLTLGSNMFGQKHLARNLIQDARSLRTPGGRGRLILWLRFCGEQTDAPFPREDRV